MNGLFLWHRAIAGAMGGKLEVCRNTGASPVRNRSVSCQLRQVLELDGRFPELLISERERREVLCFALRHHETDDRDSCQDGPPRGLRAQLRTAHSRPIRACLNAPA